jgi:hypothetical protein
MPEMQIVSNDEREQQASKEITDPPQLSTKYASGARKAEKNM